MQFIYIDESGTGEEPIGVMTGVIADSYRMRPTKYEWSSLLKKLSNIVNREIDEIHTRDLYSGNSPWRELNGGQRSAIIDEIFKWLCERKHSIIYTAVHKESFNRDFRANDKLKEIGTLWRFMALHIALSAQKRFQGSVRGKKRTVNQKGGTVMIFDHEHRKQNRFTNMLLAPPDWTDSYYDRAERQEKMDKIIDVPHFVDSKQVGLIQLSDFICFFLRKHIELQLGLANPSYRDEKEKVTTWAKLILERSIPKSNMIMQRGRCECAELFYKYIPDPLK